MGRTAQVWFEATEGDSDSSGHFSKLARWLDMEQSAEAQQAAEWQKTAGDHDSSTSLIELVIRSEDTGLGGYALGKGSVQLFSYFLKT
jgi:hypothetical protein